MQKRVQVTNSWKYKWNIVWISLTWNIFKSIFVAEIDNQGNANIKFREKDLLPSFTFLDACIGCLVF